MGYILEFKDQPAASVFSMTPEVALSFFQAKGLKPTFRYTDMIRQEHDAAFTVAKMMQVDLLDTTRKAVDQAIADGWSIGRFRKELGPILKSAGWWGKQDLADPAGNLVQGAQLGSAYRLNNIYRSNLQSAYSVGQWERIEEDKDRAPWLLYDAVDDHRTRKAHADLDNTVLPVNDPFWSKFMPPNGYGCRCGVIQLTDDDLERLGLTPSKPPKVELVKWTNPRTGKIEEIPAAVDPGWDHNPGKDRLQSLQKLAAQKINALPPEWAGKAKAAATDYKLAGSTSGALKAIDEQVIAAQAAQARAKAAQEAAQAAIDNALDNKTPYLAPAIKKVQAAKANQGLAPEAVLAKANQIAETQKKNHALSKYKNAIVSGKTPADEVAAVYEALPAAEKAKLTEQIGQLQAKKAAEQALQEIAGDSGVYAQALKKMQASGEAEDLGVVDLLKSVIAAGDAQKAKISQGLKLSNYKKKAIAGKTPTEDQAAAFNALDEAGQAKVLAEIEEAKAAQAPKPKPVESVPGDSEINVEALTQIGPQRGSNPGGLFQDTETGVQWYIKTPGSADNARNEVLAAKLYQAAGLEVPELQVIDWKGRTSIASRIVDGLEEGSPAQLAKAKGTAEGFVVDAWLANWDVVGLSYDNLLLRGSQVVRVDTGGALRYRAQGSLKGAAWGDLVTEMDSLRNPSANSQAASVFGGVSEAEMVAGARRVLSITEADIRAMVKRYGPANASEAEALVKTLIARQNDIADRFPEARTTTPAPPPVDAGARVTSVELQTIRDSRLNGYGMATDKGEIEDQEVLVWHERAGGKDLTRASLKLRGRGVDKLEALLSGEGGEVQILNGLNEKILAAVKGIAKFHNDEGLREKDLQRAREAIQEWDRVLARILQESEAGNIDAGDGLELTRHYSPWIEALRGATGAEIGQKGYWRPPADNFAAKANPERKSKAPEGLQLKKKRGRAFTVKQISRGRAEDTGKLTNAPVMDYYEAKLPDGTIVRYFAQDAEFFAMRGRLDIRAPGNDQAGTARIFAALDDLGVDSTRSGGLDSEELYLTQIAYARVQGWRDIDAKLRGMDDQTARVEALRQHLKAQIGTDPTELPGYNPQGRREAFGHGHRHRFRPDLQGADWDRFKRDYRLHHSITNGGMVDAIKAILNAGGKMAPTTDKLRRGIELGGMSPKADLHSGGASYFFTRIKTQATAGRSHGLVWKADLVGRLDAISYDGDKFGRVTGDHVLQYRKSGVEQWKAAARTGNNETIFKNSLSLFDMLEQINTSGPGERQQVIQAFRDNGYETFPDGRELEEVIK